MCEREGRKAPTAAARQGGTWGRGCPEGARQGSGPRRGFDDVPRVLHPVLAVIIPAPRLPDDGRAVGWAWRRPTCSGRSPPAAQWRPGACGVRRWSPAEGAGWVRRRSGKGRARCCCRYYCCTVKFFSQPCVLSSRRSCFLTFWILPILN